jgi:uncharacterized protein (TIGR02996 family)
MLHTHDDFLSAIASQPGDRTLRLVYADWLDEQSDPRGTLVRVEEEMRELPVFSDRFWELKPRRNTLREQIGSEWCGRMRYGTECEPVFRHGIPDGWRECWRLIREFTERWHRVPMGDVGGRQKEITEAETRLGRTLPPSVREWIAFASDAQPAAESIELDWIQLPYQAVETAPLIALFLLEPGYWAMIRHDDLHEPDPAIYAYSRHLHNDRSISFRLDEEEPVAESVSAYAFDDLLNVYGESGGYTLEVEQSSDFLKGLRDLFPTRTRFGRADYYAADNVLVRVLKPDEAEPYAIVEVCRPLLEAHISLLLGEFAHQSRDPHGIYTSSQS